MTTTEQSSTSEGLAVLASGILKTDVLGRVRVGSDQREAILDAFETSGMSGQAFARHHGIKIQTFASWIQKRRRARGDYQNEAVCRKLRMRKDPQCTRSQKEPHAQSPMNLIEVDLLKDSPKLEPLEVILPGGAIVRISHESQLELLQTLMRQLSC